jgi:hypothetical protein
MRENLAAVDVHGEGVSVRAVCNAYHATAVLEQVFEYGEVCLWGESQMNGEGFLIWHTNLVMNLSPCVSLGVVVLEGLEAVYTYVHIGGVKY